MSAVDEYRKQRDMCADDDRKDPDIAVLADAAIAELEAETNRLAMAYSTQVAKTEMGERLCKQTQAELAALKGRRCEDCGWEHCTTEDYSMSYEEDTSLVDMEENFYCARWKARP